LKRFILGLLLLGELLVGGEDDGRQLLGELEGFGLGRVDGCEEG